MEKHLQYNLFFLAVLFSALSCAQEPHKPNPADFTQPIMKAIAYGISAPNPHNTQSWFIDTLSSTEMLLYVKHVLPETDPPARQILIGAGCFIECLAIGMTGEGYKTNVEYLPQGDYEIEKNKIGSKPIAKISLIRNENLKKDVLFDFIYQRQSNRSPYKGKMITNQEFEQIKTLTGQTQSEMIFINDPVSMKPFLDIFSAAMELETRTRATNEETRKLFRFSEQERSEKKDGLSLAANGFNGIMLKIAEKSMKNGDSVTWHSEKMVQATMKSINKSIYSSKGLIFFKTSENEKTDWLNTGRDFARYNIAIAKMGFATSHYNQVIQEYPEMRSLQKEFDTLVNTQGNEKIQIIVRVGRAKPTYNSWLRNPEDFLIKK
jgi:hypothetical protein